MPSHPPSSAPASATPTIPPRAGLAALKKSLMDGGLDLAQPFSVAALLETNPDLSKGALAKPTFPLGLVVGNTRALWKIFRSHLAGLGVRNSSELGPDPLDIYVEELVLGALSELEAGHDVTAQAFFAHETQAHAPIPIQRICHHAGLARLGPAHLNVHPRHGPWIALRAVLLFDLPLEFGIAFDWTDPAESPCDGCSAPCRKALSGALLGREEDLGPLPPPPRGLSAKKARWLAVRSVCPVGREERYSDEQIRYHYDQDRTALLG